MARNDIALRTKWLGQAFWGIAGALVLIPALLACSPQTTDKPLFTAPLQNAESSTTSVQSAPAPSASQSRPANAPTLAPDSSGSQAPGGQDGLAPATPDCSNLTLTPSETEGPYYKAGSPERTSLLDAGIQGTKFVLTGNVLTPDCKLVAGAWLDFWQADAQGNYDNSGYTLRGHQKTDANGRYTLTTIVPGLYPGRTEHIHVKVQAPNGPVLTTQLYFPGVPSNYRDGIFQPAMLMSTRQTSDGMVGTFSFVVKSK